ncbi:MAG: MFS transporter [Pseudoclavibacter sp.]
MTKPLLAPAGSRVTFWRLAGMMLLQYATYGSWWATIGLVLTSNGLGSIVGLAFSLAAVAAILSPMLTGAIADRFFASQKVLAVLHALGGLVLLLIAPTVTSGNAGLLLGALFVYMLFFQPTIAVSNNIAFTHLPQDSNAFAYVRVFGTGGWIAIGLFIGQSGLSASTAIFFIAATMSFALALYSLTLPKTPPPAHGSKFKAGDLVGAGALHLFRNRSFCVLIVAVLLTCVPISIYNAFGSTYLDVVGVPNVASFMTIGQASEILFMLVLPLVLKRFTWKWVILGGLVAWLVRALALMTMTEGNITMAVFIIALHGVCTDFFLTAGFMYVDTVTRLEARAQAQSLFLLFALGVGNAIGALIAGEMFNVFVGDSTDVAAWNPLWYVSATLAGISALAVLLLFKSKQRRAPSLVYSDDVRTTDIASPVTLGH